MYNYKVYDRTYMFKRTLSPKKIATVVSFENTINKGHGDFTFEYHMDVDQIDIEHHDIIVINTNTTIIYTGRVISRIAHTNSRGNYREISCLGLMMHLNDDYYEDTGSLSFNKTDDPSTIITDILTQVNTRLGFTYFTRTAGTLTTYGTTINLDFDTDTRSHALQKCIETTDFFFMIEGNGTVHFRAYDNPSSTHVLTLGNEITSIDAEESSDAIINRVVVIYNGGATITVNDTPSQTTYGIKKKLITDTSIKDFTTATQRANALLNDHATPSGNIAVLVNKKYNLESLLPGDTVSIRNNRYPITNKTVQRVIYTTDHAEIYLDGYKSIERSLEGIL